MATWILILTLVVDQYNAGGPAITSVGGFHTRAACMSAANEWLRQARSIETERTIARAMCAESGGAP